MSLTPEAILSEPAGRRLDSWTAELVLGIKLCKHRGHPKCDKCGLNYAHWERIAPPHAYSLDMGHAWDVLHAYSERPYPEQKKFLQMVNFFIKEKSQWMTTWPEALFFLTPEAICKAALLVACESKQRAVES